MKIQTLLTTICAAVLTLTSCNSINSYKSNDIITDLDGEGKGPAYYFSVENGRIIRGRCPDEPASLTKELCSLDKADADYEQEFKPWLTKSIQEELAGLTTSIDSLETELGSMDGMINILAENVASRNSHQQIINSYNKQISAIDGSLNQNPSQPDLIKQREFVLADIEIHQKKMNENQQRIFEVKAQLVGMFDSLTQIDDELELANEVKANIQAALEDGKVRKIEVEGEQQLAEETLALLETAGLPYRVLDGNDLFGKYRPVIRRFNGFFRSQETQHAINTPLKEGDLFSISQVLKAHSTPFFCKQYGISKLVKNANQVQSFTWSCTIDYNDKPGNSFDFNCEALVCTSKKSESEIRTLEIKGSTLLYTVNDENVAELVKTNQT